MEPRHRLKEEQTAAYSVEIWKRFRKWGGIPTAITQNVKDLLASREVENIFENSDFVLMLNQAAGDRAILAKQLNISPQQMKYVTHTEAGEGLIFYGNVVLPFVDRFPKDTELYRVMTTKPEEVTIINRDALYALRELPEESVHCCVTSPPYYALRDYGLDMQIGREDTPEQYIDRLTEVFRELRRVLRTPTAAQGTRATMQTRRTRKAETDSRLQETTAFPAANKRT